MPDLDGGHGFLTTLLPLNTKPCERADGTITSPVHAVRELLSALPTAQHSPATAASGRQSPFAQSLSTHFVRFSVIDQPAFNGRDPGDAILASLPPPKDPLVAQPVDALPRPYLLFCADFDLPMGARADALKSYLRELCSQTSEVWNAILAHCDGGPVDGSAEAAATYILGCRVETTMPFNDYPVAAASGGAPAILAPLILALVAGVLAWLAQRMLLPDWPWFGALPVALIAAVLALGAAVWVLGRRSSPWAGGTDLPSVLKALHVQAAFTRFALAHQCDPPAALQAAFAAFVLAERPENLASPTQAPGIVP